MPDTTSRVTVPAVNINGSSPGTLLEALSNAVIALGNAIDTVAQTAPHERDYQTLPPEAFLAAQHEHAERIASLHGVKGDLEAIAISIIETAP